MIRGKCLCGDVQFRIDGPVHGTSLCHAASSRKWAGHAWASAHVLQEDLVIETGTESLAWYPTGTTERGFCVICGSSLFQREVEGPRASDVSVAMGALESPTGLLIGAHLYVADAGDYYEVPQNAPHFQGDQE